MTEPMDPDKAQDKLTELREQIEATKRKVAEDLSRPSQELTFAEAGTEAGDATEDADDG